MDKLKDNPEVIETTGQEEDIIRDLIIGLTLTSSYWGYLLTRVKRSVDNDSPFIMSVSSRAAESDVVLYYNKNLVEKTDKKTLILCLKHEALHILHRHLPRFFRILSRDSISPDDYQFHNYVFALASDMVVNDQLDMPAKLEIAGREAQLVLFEHYGFSPGRETEYYYYELLKRREIKKEFENYKNGFCHVRWVHGIKHIPDLSSYSRKLEHQIKGVILESYKNLSRQSRGSLPSYLEELIGETLEPPKLPYYQMIRKLVKGSKISKFRQCSTRINRKRTYLFSLSGDGTPEISPFPGKVRDFSFKIGVLIDTSGSMTQQDIEEGLKGVRSIIEKDKNCKTIVIECDTEIKKMYEVRRVQDICYKVKGRGGTTLFPALQKFKELNVDVVLAFTDGWTDNINSIKKQELPKKIIWVIPEHGSTSNVDRSGFIVRYKK